MCACVLSVVVVVVVGVVVVGVSGVCATSCVMCLSGRKPAQSRNLFCVTDVTTIILMPLGTIIHV